MENWGLVNTLQLSILQLFYQITFDVLSKITTQVFFSVLRIIMVFASGNVPLYHIPFFMITHPKPSFSSTDAFRGLLIVPFVAKNSYLSSKKLIIVLLAFNLNHKEYRIRSRLTANANAIGAKGIATIGSTKDNLINSEVKKLNRLEKWMSFANLSNVTTLSCRRV